MPMEFAWTCQPLKTRGIRVGLWAWWMRVGDDGHVDCAEISQIYAKFFWCSLRRARVRESCGWRS
jgi:hypothetical protein